MPIEKVVFVGKGCGRVRIELYANGVVGLRKTTFNPNGKDSIDRTSIEPGSGVTSTILEDRGFRPDIANEIATIVERHWTAERLDLWEKTIAERYHPLEVATNKRSLLSILTFGVLGD